MNKFLSLLIFFLIAACLYVFFIWQPESGSNNKQMDNLAEISQPEGGEFTLQALSGPVSLNDFQGKVVLVYFGYTMCPDICPTNLAMMSNAFMQMDEKELSQVQGIFISVDPQRDTVQKLSEYTQYFHPSILGMTDTAEVIREVADRYGVAYRKAVQESAANYAVDHSSETYVIDPQGHLVERLEHATPAEGILKAIRKYSIRGQSSE